MSTFIEEKARAYMHKLLGIVRQTGGSMMNERQLGEHELANYRNKNVSWRNSDV